MTFAEKYTARSRNVQSMLCVGLDSDIEKLPERFRLQDQPQFEFNKWIIDQTHDLVAAYKPNMAFYEARGAQGIAELQSTMEYLKEKYPDIATICDAKRADIGNTNTGYINAIFDQMSFDSITLHPYLGQEALQPFLDRSDKGCIILCRTSNPGAGEFQDLLIQDVPLWQTVAHAVATKWNAHKNCCLVVGATYPKEMAVIRKTVGDDMLFLVPGIGTQGGDVASVMKAGMNSKGEGLIINAARSINFSDNPRQAAQALRTELLTHSA